MRSESPQTESAEPIYYSPIWANRSSMRVTCFFYPLTSVHKCLFLGSRSSTPRRRSDAPDPVIAQPVTLLSQPGCRLSLDGSRLSSSGGSIPSFDNSSNSNLTDDSQIFSRIRRFVLFFHYWVTCEENLKIQFYNFQELWTEEGIFARSIVHSYERRRRRIWKR